jgi:hypothetical protein
LSEITSLNKRAARTAEALHKTAPSPIGHEPHAEMLAAVGAMGVVVIRKDGHDWFPLTSDLRRIVLLEGVCVGQQTQANTINRMAAVRAKLELGGEARMVDLVALAANIEDIDLGHESHHFLVPVPSFHFAARDVAHQVIALCSHDEFSLNSVRLRLEEDSSLGVGQNGSRRSLEISFTLGAKVRGLDGRNWNPVLPRTAHKELEGVLLCFVQGLHVFAAQRPKHLLGVKILLLHREFRDQFKTKGLMALALLAER